MNSEQATYYRSYQAVMPYANDLDDHRRCAALGVIAGMARSTAPLSDADRLAGVRGAIDAVDERLDAAAPPQRGSPMSTPSANDVRREVIDLLGQLAHPSNELAEVVEALNDIYAEVVQFVRSLNERHVPRPEQSGGAVSERTDASPEAVGDGDEALS